MNSKDKTECQKEKENPLARLQVPEKAEKEKMTRPILGRNLPVLGRKAGVIRTTLQQRIAKASPLHSELPLSPYQFQDMFQVLEVEAPWMIGKRPTKVFQDASCSKRYC